MAEQEGYADPLSAVTRAERKSLLLVSTIGLVIERTGLVPTKITTVGVEFSQADQRHLMQLFGAVIAYYLAAFTIYSWTDYNEWAARWKHSGMTFRDVVRRHGPYPEERDLSVPAAQWLRSIVEFIFPIVFGGYVAWVLIS
jgi:hypothetical protein